MLFSLKYLGFSYGPAALLSLIPFLLGFVNAFSSIAYALTGIVLMVAIGSAVITDEHIQGFKDLAQSLLEMVQAKK